MKLRTTNGKKLGYFDKLAERANRMLPHRHTWVDVNDVTHEYQVFSSTDLPWLVKPCNTEV